MRGYEDYLKVKRYVKLVGNEKATIKEIYNQEICVVYLSEGGMHYRFRCSANSKREAKKICKENLGITDEDIVEVMVEE